MRTYTGNPLFLASSLNSTTVLSSYDFDNKTVDANVRR